MFLRFLIFLRDKVIPYLLLMAIIGGLLGGASWLIITTYFWNTSQLTVLVDDDVLSAEIRISSRIVYRDFSIFGVNYPFHIVFPWNETVACKRECIFFGLPRGDAEIFFMTDRGTSGSENIVIEPGTQGKLNLRSTILMKEVIDSVGTGITAPKNDILPADIPAGSIFYQNTFQGLFLFRDRGMFFLYDTSGKQIVMLPQILSLKSIVRGAQEGAYYLVSNQDEVWFFDRYGRQKTEKVTHSATSDGDIIWEEAQTKVKIGEKEQIFPGRLFWSEYEKRNYLFNGEKIFEIIKS